ncbi:MAG: T9SS type A sorting domain-containing protein [Saprospiraceae bacterium]
MKEIFLLLIIKIAFIYSLSAQQTAEFETTIYAMDLNGNIDSVVIGYDAAASDDIDTQFGEIDITTQPWDSTFEIRVSPKFNKSNKLGKKQIAYYDCPFNGPGVRVAQINLSIHANTPIVFTWDMQDFQDDCIDSSAIVDDNTFFLYPFLGLGRSMMAQRPNHGSTFDLPNYFYSYYQGNIEGGGTDTIFNVFIGFIDDIDDLVSTEQQKELQSKTKVFPNPMMDNFTIELPESYFSESVQIFDITGREVYQSVEKSNQINVSSMNWAKGIYFYKVQLEDGIIVSGKVVKE